MVILPISWEKGFKGSRIQGFPVKVNGIFDKLFVFQGFDHRFQHSLDIPDPPIHLSSVVRFLPTAYWLLIPAALWPFVPLLLCHSIP